MACRLHDFRYHGFVGTIIGSDNVPLRDSITTNRNQVGSKPHERRTQKEDAMPTYLITEIEVTNPEGYEEYRSRVGESLEAYGAKFLVRGGEIEVLEGDWKPKRIVMCVFDSMEKAREWYESEAYRKLKKVREGTASMNMLAVEGV